MEMIAIYGEFVAETLIAEEGKAVVIFNGAKFNHNVDYSRARVNKNFIIYREGTDPNDIIN